MNILAFLTQQAYITEAKSLELAPKIIADPPQELKILCRELNFSYNELAAILAEKLQLPLMDFTRFNTSKLPAILIDTHFLQQEKVIPLARRGERLVLATSNPLNKNSLQKIRERLRLELDLIVVSHQAICDIFEPNSIESTPEAQEAINTAAISTASQNLKQKIQEQLNKSAIKVQYDDVKNNLTSSNLKRNENDIDDTPVVRFLQKILMEAVQARASDLHFEPFEKNYRVRFRIDGVLHEVSNPPIEIKDKLASRIKVLSKLDISEKRVPQDGRMRVNLDKDAKDEKANTLDLRVSTLPTLFGEKIVIRILENNQAQLNIDQLGYENWQKEIILKAIAKPEGMVLVTGPTGSGKTVSLYTFLYLLNDGLKNISSAEDPAEIQVEGINQVNINDKAGLTFASALKAFLRQDPDIIMLGEIRDLETADIALKAAQTGHLVFSTLHTNDAPSTLVRLLNMGVASFNIASSIHLITAQRLARRLCPHCKVSEPIPVESLKDAGFNDEDCSNLGKTWHNYQPVGCEHCSYTGYKGRIGIYQVMPVTEAIQIIILKHGSALDIAKQAKLEGILSLREAGLLKVKEGVTSLQEVLNNTSK